VPDVSPRIVHAPPSDEVGLGLLQDALKRIVNLYEAWDSAEPGQGYDAKAAEWRAKHDLAAAPTPKSQQTSP
jgi:hypothetical protein